MKLMNFDEEIPAELFIFTNLMNPITKLNLDNTKGFTSGTLPFINDENSIQQYMEGNINYLPFIKNKQKTFGSLSMFCVNVINDYRVEYDAELCRMYKFPTYPSRFSSIFAFGDYESCIEVSINHRWDINSVKKFKIIEHPLTRVVKVNMEIVSLARGLYNCAMFSKDEINNLWRAYWEGDGNFSCEIPDLNSKDKKRLDSGVTYEYLIEGRVEII